MNCNAMNWQSLLYCPGSSEKMLGKARTMDNIDAVIMDLEDAVAASEKDIARDNVCKALREKDKFSASLIVRINALDSPYAWDDLAAVCPLQPCALVLPKATTAGTLSLDAMLTMLELKNALPVGGIGIIPLIELARSLMEIRDMLRASSRVCAAQFGAEDYTRDMCIPRRKDNTEILMPRSLMAIACREAGVACLDTPYVQFKDGNGCLADTEFIRSIGMTGRTMIHPSVADIVNGVFCPSQEELERAARILEAYRAATAEGKGAVSVDGEMIDAPVAARSEMLLKRGAIKKATK